VAALALAALVLAAFASPSFAATGSLAASGATNPNGELWLGSHLWVADHLQGMCRVDSGGLNGLTCAVAAKAAGQPAYDAGNQFVYVPDSAANKGGVVRYTFDPTSETLGNPVVLAPNAGLAGNKPDTVALGPDGNLYVGFLKNGNIVRITNPGGATQTVQSAAASSDGKKVLGMTFVGNDLYLAESAAVSRILNVTASSCTGGCKGSSLGLATIASPLSLTTDAGLTPTPSPRYLYIGDVSSVHRYNLDNGALDTYATSGSTTSGTFNFSNVTGLGVDPSDNLYVGDDPTAGAQNLQGRIWSIAAGSSPLPSTPPPPPPPPPGGGGGGAPLATGTLYAQNETNPNGQVWLNGALGGHLWVADHLQGMCRVEGGSINGSTCQVAAIAAGEPAYDPNNQFVYVPDSSAKSAGVVRYTFNPASETLGNPVVLAPNAGLGGNRPDAVALGSDGSLYVGFLKNGNLVRITNPAGNGQTAQTIGQSSTAKKVLSMAASGSDLYLAENGVLSRVSNVASCGGSCKAASVGLATVASPLSVAATATQVFIGDVSAVYRYTPATGALATYATSGTASTGTFGFQNVSGLGIDPATGNVYVGDDPTAGNLNLQGRIWLVAPPA
jgi:sugar lactone lactonase YvrE